MIRTRLFARKTKGSTTKPSYNVYVARLTQNGLNAPVATILENKLGFVPVWQRDGIGVYSSPCAPFADASKIALLLTPHRVENGRVGVENDGLQINLSTYNNVSALADDVMNNGTTIEIRQYL